ncbi:MAG: ATPase [Bacteroidetes bacterium]|nr:MAG: ATPase [Bacteroidota bacterium]
MKIKQIILQNYKKFVQEKKISFVDSDGNINEKTLLIGNNGAGKTSILQAIVVLLGGAIREHFSIQDLEWSGYEFRHLQTGKLPLKIEIEIVFEEEELVTILKYALELKAKGIKLGTMPSSKKNITLYLDYQKNKIFAKEGLAAFNQLSGYQYAKSLAIFTPNKNTLFENVGNIYWYDEQRNAYNVTNFVTNSLEKKTNLNDIRSFLASAHSYHLAIKEGKRTIQEGQFDFYEKLESIYTKVFQGRKFIGSTPRFDVYEATEAPDFFLFDGKNEYEISCMSAGERAIFPILMDFARWNINNSIIIIDELELHLHPSLQQNLVRVLSKLGKNNQFIFTTHSENIVSMFDENQIIKISNE